jgi:hypothetical protein
MLLQAQTLSPGYWFGPNNAGSELLVMLFSDLSDSVAALERLIEASHRLTGFSGCQAGRGAYPQSWLQLRMRQW